MGERTRNEMGNLSLQTKNKFPRDLLQRFMVGSGDPGRSDPEEDPDPDLELNLGLSMGGRFGVDKSSNKLVRASSVATILPVVRDDEVLGGKTDPDPGRSYSNLVRTSSLPVETEDEWRKRKELQSLRRLAAKRRRSEKQRSLTRGEREEYVAAMGRVGSSVAPLHGSPNWVPGGKQAGFSGGIPSGGGRGFGQPSSQGSLESQAGSCSSMSEFEGRHLQGSGSGGEASPVSMQSIQDAPGPSRSRPTDPSPRPEPEPPARTKETGLGSTDMPCVFTQGDGPNGRRIEGILYKYGKGEEVKIMCVCHGSFLSPAEFVVHAGGTDVDHPLRHIVVNPNSSASSYL